MHIYGQPSPSRYSAAREGITQRQSILMRQAEIQALRFRKKRPRFHIPSWRKATTAAPSGLESHLLRLL
ncbi:hypothetical protein PHLCEN_2v9036 [Hermanssonia centrifuga]|uniref:Uncharacterized protein n=1 Tax=Hermanssonia centrifuga TaxID=98765 RepID=A0A2R6NRT1_9APHY|nr:hypothetical protein PHLCEN_2v9036 [Hermanssonia centrifuga]